MENRDQIIKDNLGLVYACAKRFKGRGIEYEDLVQAGCIGLIKAYDRFDKQKGYAFSTYAVPVILGEIKYLFRKDSSLKVSRSLKELSIKVSRIVNQIVSEKGTSPTVSEVAHLLGVKPELVVEAMNAGQIPISLSSSEDGKQIDVPVDSEDEKIAENVALKQALNKLDTLDKSIIELRFFKLKTQTETARLLGITQVKVSRKEKKIISQLRTKLSS